MRDKHKGSYRQYIWKEKQTQSHPSLPHNAFPISKFTVIDHLLSILVMSFALNSTEFHD